MSSEPEHIPTIGVLALFANKEEAERVYPHATITRVDGYGPTAWLASLEGLDAELLGLDYAHLTPPDPAP